MSFTKTKYFQEGCLLNLHDFSMLGNHPYPTNLTSNDLFFSAKQS